MVSKPMDVQSPYHRFFPEKYYPFNMRKDIGRSPSTLGLLKRAVKGGVEDMTGPPLRKEPSFKVVMQRTILAFTGVAILAGVGVAINLLGSETVHGNNDPVAVMPANQGDMPEPQESSSGDGGGDGFGPEPPTIESEDGTQIGATDVFVSPTPSKTPESTPTLTPAEQARNQLIKYRELLKLGDDYTQVDLSDGGVELRQGNTLIVNSDGAFNADKIVGIVDNADICKPTPFIVDPKAGFANQTVHKEQKKDFWAYSGNLLTDIMETDKFKTVNNDPYPDITLYSTMGYALGGTKNCWFFFIVPRGKPINFAMVETEKGVIGFPVFQP